MNLELVGCTFPWCFAFWNESLVGQEVHPPVFDLLFIYNLYINAEERLKV